MTRYRLVYLGLTLALLALVGATWALSTTGGSEALPAVVERISPAPGATVLRQASVVVDMAAGYTVTLTIDGVPIPMAEVRSIDAIGTFEWQPGAGQVIGEWTPGPHEVEISWDTLSGLPDLGSFAWGFRVQ